MAEKQKFRNKRSLIMSEEFILLTHEFPPFRGGAGVYCEELATAAFKMDIKIDVWAPKRSKSSEEIPILELPWKGSQSWTSSFRLIRRLKREFRNNDRKPMLHFAEPGASRALLRFGWMLPKSIKIMLTVHGSELLRFNQYPLESLFFKKALARCFRIHVLSKYNFDQLSGFCPQAKNKIIIVPGAPSSMVVAFPHKKEETGGKEIRLLCVGRIHPRKGQLLLLETCKSLPLPIQQNLSISLVGPVIDEKYAWELKKFAKTFLGKIEVTGEVPDEKLREFYQNSDLFVMTPTVQKKSVEGFGFVYLEASSHGLPILATRVGGVEDAVLHGKTGLLANPHCIDDIRSKLLKLVNDEELRKRLGDEGQKWSQSHSWEKVARKLYLAI